MAMSSHMTPEVMARGILTAFYDSLEQRLVKKAMDDAVAQIRPAVEAEAKAAVAEIRGRVEVFKSLELQRTIIHLIMDGVTHPDPKEQKAPL